LKNKKEPETGKKTGEKTGEKIISLIKENPEITTNELAEKLNISVKGIEWQIRNRKEQGILKRIGPDKGGYWEIIEK
jgi:ATP-dependent DNA helicase RecG